MKPAAEWIAELDGVPIPPEIEVLEGRGGESTLRVGDVYLHSRYNPREEAVRLVDSAELDAACPVLVLGLGLGYHVLELLERGLDVAAVEPSHAVAKLALDGPLRGADIVLGLGDPDAIASTDAFREFAARRPQLLTHPPTARIHPAFTEAMSSFAARAALAKERLGVAVVGPMYGGSLPIAGYLERAFRTLGHRTLLVDNSVGWGLYDRVSGSVKSKNASGQLTGLLVNFLNEWSYARVAEFAPEVCIVMAQAPVGSQFPARLANHGIVSAF
jgi:spore maturation protein CgeB